ncbi:NUDIX hydrolase [Nocardioides terrisoli]|uniref:NUDIX hydrolase n=1 Tax=Nocardioides terrisoli TaxID=3388267 RepID=UPI00287B8156|nr:NUDIX hydrolase [Nocardioides marmorisolisilvae]
METIDSAQVHENPWFAVRQDTIRRRDGSIGQYWLVDSADIALVVPLDGKRLHLVEQDRHPIGRRSWEFPSGTVDRADPDPATTATRELREETGLVTGGLSLVGRFDVTPSTLTQSCSVFLATELAAGAPQRELEEQDMRSAWFTRAEVEQMIVDGSLADAKSLAAYALLLAAGVLPPL